MMNLVGRTKNPPAMTLEGVLGPNSRLDEAEGLAIDGPDAVAVHPDGRLLVSSGKQVVVLPSWGAASERFAMLDAAVTALCVSRSGQVAVGLEGGRLAMFDSSGQPLNGWELPAGQAVSVVDCAFRSDDELLLVDCGYPVAREVLARAAWDAEPRGKLLSLRRSGEVEVIHGKLHAPMGLSLDQAGRPQVSLLERAAIVDERGAAIRSGLPGYLGRLRQTQQGYLLACLARRDPLIEFLKTERGFVATMKDTVDVAHWIAPRVSPEFSHDFPIELGATRLFGEVKPWAPSFSYGLLIEMDAQLVPVGSLQSRANGRRHAISDVAIWDEAIVAVSKGSGELLKLARGCSVS
ncbi:hypothetical protein [Tianweitania sediminis]|uniref:Strictosidine synthase conserved region domain-containing protein n=1 Tax=Tianweitania sediminis TaxID=1502156 RepID=A0A8J7RJ99_9HYPH|nr:hypothetical protein [Tianweitania sediminis]MBP0439481.1 hypothetical protein [Tianweitania sediminis]